MSQVWFFLRFFYDFFTHSSANVEEFSKQLKDENRKIQSVEDEVSELVIARNQLNLRMTDYEAEGIDMKTKCDELKRTGIFNV